MIDRLSVTEDSHIKISRKLLVGFLILCSVWLPISLMRWLNLGFNPVFIVHISMTVYAFFVFMRINQQNYIAKYLCIIVLSTLIALTGIYNYGLQGGGTTLIVFAIFITAFVFGVKAAITYLILICVLMAFVGYSNHIGGFETASHNNFGRSHFAAWAYLICIIAFTSILFLITAHEIYRNTQNSFLILKQQKEEIEHLANHDHLTGLPTPRLADEQLNLAIRLAKRHEDKVAVIYIDIDKFKYINDTYGHDTGDFALREIATTLKQLTRDSDIASRQGGDEFVVILNYPTSHDDCEKVCKRLIKSFEHKRSYKSHSFNI